MRCFISKSNNPYFNLATEEYFLKKKDEEFFMIYINDPCIVVGKHQNLLAEINLRHAIDNKIKLVRRISGGGTVYQDLNNLNFSFIHNSPNPDLINFVKYTFPVLSALKDMKLNAEFSGRNDLLLDTKKISGNAMHIFKSRILSHGTLLFNTDLEQLHSALATNSCKYTDKSIKSVKSEVTNISAYLDNAISISKFLHQLFNGITSKLTHSYVKSLDEEEEISINQISNEKFKSWDWIYGYSPKYLFQNSFNLLDITVNIELIVEKGIIKSLKTYSDGMLNPDYRKAFESLVNARHDFQTICGILSRNKVLNSIPKFNISNFYYNLF